MPSALIRDHCMEVESQLMEFKWEFRIAQAEESLDELCRKIIIKTYVLDYKKAYGHGQRQGTKSAKLLKDCQASKTRCSVTYQHAQSAMEVLFSRITRLGWRAIYQPLDSDDTRPALTNNVEGEGRRKLSWIWMAPGTGKSSSLEHVQEGTWTSVLATSSSLKCHQIALRLEWLNSRARAQRRAEECLLLQEEMQCVLQALKYEAEQWKKHAEMSVEGMNDGTWAFTLRQSSLRMAMHDNCAHSWSSVLAWLTLGLVPDGDIEMSDEISET